MDEWQSVVVIISETMNSSKNMIIWNRLPMFIKQIVFTTIKYEINIYFILIQLLATCEKWYGYAINITIGKPCIYRQFISNDRCFFTQKYYLHDF